MQVACLASKFTYRKYAALTLLAFCGSCCKNTFKKKKMGVLTSVLFSEGNQGGGVNVGMLKEVSILEMYFNTKDCRVTRGCYSVLSAVYLTKSVLFSTVVQVQVCHRAKTSSNMHSTQ